MKPFFLTAALILAGGIACSEQTPAPGSTPAENWSGTQEDKGALHRIVPPSDLNSFFECLEAEQMTLVSAHRGGVPENSLEGMAKTLTQVPAIMEVDVATTADGRLILMHDDTLDRTTTGSGLVENTNFSTIAGLYLRDKSGHTTEFQIPTFADTLAWAAGKTILQIDFKPTTDFDDVIAEVRRQKATDRIVYIAYTLGQAWLLHKKHPEAMISITLDDTSDLATAKARGIPVEKMLGWTGNHHPSQAVFDQLNDNDIEVIFGTLGGKTSRDKKIARTGKYNEYTELASMGIDLLATDQPVDAHKALIKSGLTQNSSKCGVN